MINWRVHKLEEKVFELEQEIKKLMERERAKEQCRHDWRQIDQGGKLTSVCQTCGTCREIVNKPLYTPPPKNCA